ncbi:MAG: alanine--glyoxylate aminotransferase family protein [Candidatus Brocadiae bacterium]|nr:alanine--glyoxylate aminotransferase family protein [Candidatus Brocadiia bacterium]
MHKKLFIPGPVEVKPEVLQACAAPLIGHRVPEYAELHGACIEPLRRMLGTKNDILLFTCSSTGVMEASVRNCAKKGVVVCMLGAFSDRWAQICLQNGKKTAKCQVEWGKAIRAEMIEKHLKTGEYDCVLLVHNETSTGVMNPIEEIADMMKRYPDVVFVVDAVSSMAGVKIDVDRLGIDVILAGTQKAFGLPVGLTVSAISPKAFARAKELPDRGYYFDFIEMKAFGDKNQTPSTPNVSIIGGLKFQLERFEKEGFENRYRRHANLKETCWNWMKEHGFGLFPEKGFESVTLTCASNTRKVDVPKWVKRMSDRGFVISEGYGRLKNDAFRVAHMADCTMDDLKECLGVMSEELKKL